MKNLRKIITIPKVFNNMTFDHNLVPNYKPKGVSLTNPDAGLSIYDIINKFTRGLPVPVNGSVQGTYSDIDMTPYQKMDKFEKLHHAARIKLEIQRAEQMLQKQKSEEAKLKQAQEMEALIEEKANAKASDLFKSQRNES